MNEIKIIKDLHEELYFACYKSEYDDENEVSIIASGQTEIEALQKAANSIYKSYRVCQSELRKISESLDNNNSLGDKFLIDSCYIERPCDFEDGHIVESFDALFWNEEPKLWSRFYR